MSKYPPAVRSGLFTGRILTLGGLGVEFGLKQRNASDFPWSQIMQFEGDHTSIINSNFRYDVGDGVIRKVDKVYYGEDKFLGWGTYIEIAQSTANTLVNNLQPRVGTQGYFRLIPPDMV